jgi:NifB/MoaA-like Fe-S oxidoreductase
VLDEYPELATICVVPLGVSAHNTEAAMRPHTPAEAVAVLDTVERWQSVFLRLLGRRLVHAADEYHLLAGRPFPPADVYEGFPMHEDGVGMARLFEAEFSGRAGTTTGPRSGFFAWVDGAPAEGYRAGRTDGAVAVAPPTSRARGVAVLTGELGARVLAPLLDRRPGVRVLPVDNRFFGGNIGVTGLLVGDDLARVLAGQPDGDRYLLPDVCLSQGRFLDGGRPGDLPRAVEVVPTHGAALREAIGR